MFLDDISSKRKIDKILIECDQCGKKFKRSLIEIQRQRKRRNGKDLCKSCSGLKKNRYEKQPKKIKLICEDCGKQFKRSYGIFIKNKEKNERIICINCANKRASKNRLQCQKKYWDIEKRKKHGEIIRNSEAHKKAMRIKDISKEKNGMYSKKHKDSTKLLMSISRTGKKQSDETIKKRIITFKNNRERKIQLGIIMIKSINSTLKHYINLTYRWNRKILERDEFKCTKCNSKEKLNAHHIKPFSVIIKDLLKNTNFKTDLEKYDYLKEQPELIDLELKNGVTLCRKCHKSIHKKWGSHNAESN